MLSYTLKPKGLSGTALLDHMTQHLKWDIQPASRTYDIDFVNHLDLAIPYRIEHKGDKTLMVSDQLKAVMPTELDLTQGSILKDIGTAQGTRKMPKRILNQLGEINAYTVSANSEPRRKR